TTGYPGVRAAHIALALGAHEGRRRTSRRPGAHAAAALGQRTHRRAAAHAVRAGAEQVALGRSPRLIRAFLPSPPVLRGRGVGGEGVRLSKAQSPSPPAPLPRVTGERGEVARLWIYVVRFHFAKRERLLATNRAV